MKNADADQRLAALAERMATLEEWHRNHENRHNNTQTITLVWINVVSAASAALCAAGLTVMLT